MNGHRIHSQSQFRASDELYFEHQVSSDTGPPPQPFDNSYDLKALFELFAETLDQLKLIGSAQGA